ncbi:uncharacterized protein isoform X2 [Rhodnius prolixus]
MKWIMCLASVVSVIEGTRVDKEIQDLLNLIPQDRVLNICMRYAIRDQQIKSLLSYIKGDHFKQNIDAMENSEEFRNLAAVTESYNVNTYALLIKFNSLLDMVPVGRISAEVKSEETEVNGTKRNGILNLMKDVLEVIPLEEIKRAYCYKLRTNPQFKLFERNLMKQIQSGEIRDYLQPFINSRPFQDTVKDLQLMGLPIGEMKQCVELTLTNFFDIGTSVETEVQELLEMVPYDKVLEICMEYAIGDPQVKVLLNYLCGDHFKQNLAEMEDSDEFQNLANAARVVDIDAYALANKFITALNSLPNRGNVQHPFLRRKRSPGDGLSGLIREALEITPLEDMKTAYRYKLQNNPQLKMFEQSLIERVLSGEVRHYVEPLIYSKPFQEIKRDLEEMGLPLQQIREFIELKLIEFFDLDQTIITPTSATVVTEISSFS